MKEPVSGAVQYGSLSLPGADAALVPVYDVAIIGAGVVGCALAYELSQYRVRTVLLERHHDVGEGTSKANSAIIHTGFDAKPGTLESQLVVEASRVWPALARKLKVPFKETSALLVATDDDQLWKLPELAARSRDNGVDDIEHLSADRALAMEPHLTDRTRGALLVHRESIIDPFAVSVAFAEVALRNGVDIFLGVHVTAVHDPDAAVKRVVLDGAWAVSARIVINAAGLGSRDVARAYGGVPFDINPRRGQFVVYDRHAGDLVRRILLPIPTEHSKGMLVTPTIFGNLLAGPTAEDLPPGHDWDTGTTAAGLAQVKKNAARMCPILAEQPVIATYAGLRCNCAQGSYWIRFNDNHPGMVTVSGVRSTGLTASIALARHLVAGLSRECDLVLAPDPGAVDSRADSAWPGWWQHPHDDPEAVRLRPDYADLVCACEHVSRGEITDALDSPLAPRTLDAIKRRTRALTGRCQAFHCGAAVARIIHQHCGVPLGQVTKHGPGSEWIHDGSGVVAGAPGLLPAPALGSLHYAAVIIGAGPAGIGAAVGLARRGVAPVLLIERSREPGGVPARYASRPGGVPTFVVWTRGRVMFGRDYAAELAQKLRDSGTEVWLGAQVIDVERVNRVLTVVGPAVGKVRVTADAVIMACGAREKSIAERGWIVGQRPARVFPTMQLLDVMDGDWDGGAHPVLMQRPVVLGSDLIAYAAAAKLRAHGTAEPVLIDRRPDPAAALPGRLYFRRWSHPEWISTAEPVELLGPHSATQVRTATELLSVCDGVVVSGDLTPSSELAVQAGLDVHMPERYPVLRGGVAWSEPGWFAAGNITGRNHGAQWCYFHGKRAARAVAAYLRTADRR